MALGFKETLELVISADPSGAVSALEKTASAAKKSGDAVESSLSRVGTSMMKVGVSGLGAGALLMQMASGDIEAANQLKAAIGQVGQSYNDFSERIDEVVAAQVRFGHTDEEVNGALTTLTLSFGDTGKAIDRMQLVADLAARKHISLADAAGVVAKAHGGAGRVFKEFGIQVAANSDGTKDYDGALDVLSNKLQGQASAAADTWGGKLKALRAEIENQVSAFGQKWGPTIMAVSGAMTVLGGITTGVGSAIKFVQGAHAAAAFSAAEEAEATTALVAAEVAETDASIAVLAANLAQTGGTAGLAVAQTELTGNTMLSVAALYAEETAGEAAGVGLAAALGPMALIAVGAAILIPLMGGMGSATRNAAVESANYTQALQRQGDMVRQSIDAETASALSKDKTAQKAAGLGVTWEEMTAAARNGTAASGELTNKLDALAASHKLNWLEAGHLRDTIDQLHGKLTDTTDATNAQGDASGELGPTTEELTKKFQDQAAALDALNKMHQELLDTVTTEAQGIIALDEAQIAARSSIDEMNKSLADGKLSNDDHKKAVDAAKDSILREADAAGTLAEKQAQAAGETDTAGARQRALVGELQGVAATLDPNSSLAQWLNAYIWKLAAVPTSITTTVNVVESIHGTYAGQAARGIVKGIEAAGDDDWRGGWAWVGDNGPELLRLPQHSQIMPNNRAMALAGGGGVVFAPVINVSTMDASGVDLKVLEALHSAVRVYDVPDAIKQAFSN